MPRFITGAELRGFASKKTIAEQATIRKSASTRSLDGSTFLSHSSKDLDLVVGATIVLENHGAKVYVDEIDPDMPPYTTAKTAALLKSRINETKRFVLLASENSKDSKWVPWELGIADGYKGMSQIALFPASDHKDEMAWAEWEYLGLYRRIVWGEIKGYEKPLWMVWNHRANEAAPLSDWLRG